MNLGAPKTPLVNYSPKGFGYFLAKFVKCSRSGGKKFCTGKAWLENVDLIMILSSSQKIHIVLHRFCTGSAQVRKRLQLLGLTPQKRWCYLLSSTL